MDIPFIEAVLLAGIIYLVVKVQKLEGCIKGMKYSLEQVVNKEEIA